MEKFQKFLRILVTVILPILALGFSGTAMYIDHVHVIEINTGYVNQISISPKDTNVGFHKTNVIVTLLLNGYQRLNLLQMIMCVLSYLLMERVPLL